MPELVHLTRDARIWRFYWIVQNHKTNCEQGYSNSWKLEFKSNELYERYFSFSMLKMSMNAWKDHMTAFQTSPPALTFLAHITVSVFIVTRKTTPVCQKVLSTSCSELNCALATSCKDIFFGICLRKSDSNLIIDWHCICWFCDNSRWMYMVHSHAILPAPSPYFSFKAVSKPSYAIIFQSFQSASFSISIYSAPLLSLMFGAAQFSARNNS